jgi:hypothetical protein
MKQRSSRILRQLADLKRCDFSYMTHFRASSTTNCVNRKKIAGDMLQKIQKMKLNETTQGARMPLTYKQRKALSEIDVSRHAL